MSSRYRAVFDLGSGTVKCALCTRQTGNPQWQQLFGEEREAFVGYSVKHSGSKNSIPESMQQHLVTTLGSLIAEIVNAFEAKHGMALNSIPRSAAATAVYRECKNGKEVLDMLSARFSPFPIHIITQAQEALSGFLTGVQLGSAAIITAAAAATTTATQQAPPRELVVWDSGGSSFQLSRGSCRERRGREVWSLEHVYEGRWGNSKTAHFFMQSIQRKSDDDMVQGKATMNPVTPEQFEALIDHLKNDHKSNTSQESCAWINDAVAKKVPLMSIGGGTSAFKLSTLACGKNQDDPSIEKRRITAAELREAAHTQFLCRSDNEIDGERYLQRNVAVGKVALLVSVLETYGFENFVFFQSVGTCLGIASLEEFWQHDQKESGTTGTTAAARARL